MSTVIAVWPDNTVSVLRMWRDFTALDLFNELDAEANPLDAKCYLVTSDCDGMHITFDWKRRKTAEASKRRIVIGNIAGRFKRLYWPEGIQEAWIKSLTQ